MASSTCVRSAVAAAAGVSSIFARWGAAWSGRGRALGIAGAAGAVSGGVGAGATAGAVARGAGAAMYGATTGGGGVISAARGQTQWRPIMAAALPQRQMTTPPTANDRTGIQRRARLLLGSASLTAA